MNKKQFKRAYKSLNVTEYKGIVKDTLIPYFDECDGEFITMLTSDTVFTIEKHYYNNKFMGWNIKTNDMTLETKSSKRKAVRFIKRLKKYNKKRSSTDES